MANRTQKEPVYATFGVHQIAPVVGWQAVYWDTHAAQHFCAPLHVLALVTRTVRDVHTTASEPEPYTEHLTPEECREVVGLEYTDAGFSVCDETDNFCGLLPPERTLADFECGCFHRAVPEPAQSVEGG